MFRMPRENPRGDIVLMVAQTICAGQVFYWRRQRTVAVPSADKNIVISHFLAFASKIGFIFGGALFSLYFPRHVPEFDLDYLSLSWRGGILIAILFALCCYTLELERLGDALQEKPGQEALREPD